MTAIVPHPMIEGVEGGGSEGLERDRFGLPLGSPAMANPPVRAAPTAGRASLSLCSAGHAMGLDALLAAFATINARKEPNDAGI
jgi:hypothetical protein